MYISRMTAPLLAAFLASSGFAFAAHAQGAGNVLSGYQQNANEPIDIAADMLEVDDKRQIATFKGNVTATQGSFNLQANELEVTYQRGGGGAASGADAMGGGDIRFIRARGRVFVTAKDKKQTATSNQAFFDVKAQKVTLEGDVTLSQGGNIIKGEKLLIDIATGVSTFEQGESGKQRLRAVFRRNEGAQPAQQGSGQRANPSGGWQTQNQ